MLVLAKHSKSGLKKSAKAVNNMEAGLLTIKQVAEIFGVSTRTISRMVKESGLPKPIKYGKKVIRWREADIQSYING